MDECIPININKKVKELPFKDRKGFKKICNKIFKKYFSYVFSKI